MKKIFHQNKMRNALALVAILVVFYALAGSVALPTALEMILPGKLSKQLNRTVHIQNIRCNPFRLTLTVQGLEVTDVASTDNSAEPSPFIQWESLFANIQLWSGFNLAPGIRILRLTRPSIRIVRQSVDTFNFSDLFLKDTGDPPDAGKAEEQPDAGKKPFVLAIDNLEIVDGRVDFTDHAAPATTAGAPAVFTLDDINLGISGFSTAPATRADADLHLRMNRAADIDLTGTFGIAPLATDGRLTVSRLAVPWVQPYIPPSIKLQTTDGKISLAADIGVKTDPASGISAAITGDTTCNDLVVVTQDRGEPFLSMDTLSVTGIHATLKPTQIQMDQILLAGLTQTVIIDKNGGLNMTRAFSADPPEAAPGTPVVSPDDKPVGSPGKQAPASGETRTPAPDANTDRQSPPNPETLFPFPVKIGEVVLRDIAIDFTDKKIQPNFATQLTLADGQINGLTSESFTGAGLTINGAVDRHAPLVISGSINPFLQDILLDLSFNLQQMDLSSISPYTGKYIGRTIQKGKLNLDLSYNIKEQVLAAENRVLLDQFTLGEKVKSPDSLNLPVGLAVALLKDRSGKINLDIPVSGRLDNPAFSVRAIILQALKNILVKAAASPFDLVTAIAGRGEELRFIAFAPGTAGLTDQARKKLDDINELLYRRPALGLEITGHVDPVDDGEALTRAALERKLREMKWADSKNSSEKAAETITLTDTEYYIYLQKLYAQTGIDRAAPGHETAPPTGSDTPPDSDAMQTALMKQMAVKDAELLLLAGKRAQAVKNYLLASDRVTADRLFVLEGRISRKKSKKAMPAARVSLGLTQK
ncbi:MAG: DUF748 domain-containing protein [Thermodesulfobacteriota bacterium]|nr:DUF748 domain-containing protein [Thermodesulfobacteriota bacterium]